MCAAAASPYMDSISSLSQLSSIDQTDLVAAAPSLGPAMDLQTKSISQF